MGRWRGWRSRFCLCWHGCSCWTRSLLWQDSSHQSPWAKGLLHKEVLTSPEAHPLLLFGQNAPGMGPTASLLLSLLQLKRGTEAQGAALPKKRQGPRQSKCLMLVLISEQKPEFSPGDFTAKMGMDKSPEASGPNSTYTGTPNRIPSPDSWARLPSKDALTQGEMHRFCTLLAVRTWGKRGHVSLFWGSGSSFQLAVSPLPLPWGFPLPSGAWNTRNLLDNCTYSTWQSKEVNVRGWVVHQWDMGAGGHFSDPWLPRM